jgi:hypothetical protein
LIPGVLVGKTGGKMTNLGKRIFRVDIQTHLHAAISISVWGGGVWAVWPVRA